MYTIKVTSMYGPTHCLFNLLLYFFYNPGQNAALYNTQENVAMLFGENTDFAGFCKSRIFF